MKKLFYLLAVISLTFVVISCTKQNNTCCKEELTNSDKEVKVVVTMKIKEEKQELFLAAFRKMADETRKEKGCIYYDLHKDTKDSLTYILLESWATQEDLDTHGKTEHMKIYKEESADTSESSSINFVKKVY